MMSACGPQLSSNWRMEPTVAPTSARELEREPGAGVQLQVMLLGRQ